MLSRTFMKHFQQTLACRCFFTLPIKNWQNWRDSWQWLYCKSDNVCWPNTPSTSSSSSRVYRKNQEADVTACCQSITTLPSPLLSFIQFSLGFIHPLLALPPGWYWPLYQQMNSVIDPFTACLSPAAKYGAWLETEQGGVRKRKANEARRKQKGESQRV